MKHLFNDISYQERKKILEQHQGGMHIDNKKFHRLLTEKLGNVKPLVEQSSNDTNKSNIDKMIENEGYQKVTKVSLPDGTYIYEGSGDICRIYDQDGKTETGYVVEMPYSIRGMWKPEKVQVKNGAFVAGDFKSIIFKNVGYKPTPQSQDKGESQEKVNKVASEGIKNVIPQMISSPPFKGTYSGYVISGTFGGVQYAWDLNDVEGMQGIRGMQEGIILTENNSYLPEIGITDANHSGFWVGWGIGRSTEFVCYYTKDNKYVVKRPQ